MLLVVLVLFCFCAVPSQWISMAIDVRKTDRNVKPTFKCNMNLIPPPTHVVLAVRCGGFKCIHESTDDISDSYIPGGSFVSKNSRETGQ